MNFHKVLIRIPEEIVQRVREIKAARDTLVESGPYKHEPISLNSIYVRAMAEGLGLDGVKTEGENG